MKDMKPSIVCVRAPPRQEAKPQAVKSKALLTACGKTHLSSRKVKYSETGTIHRYRRNPCKENLEMVPLHIPNTMHWSAFTL